jgi:hypothetical protein
MGNRQLAMLLNGRPTPAAPFVRKKQLRLVPGGKVNSMILSDASTGVAGHVSNSLFIFELRSVRFRRFLTSTHLAPSFM